MFKFLEKNKATEQKERKESEKMNVLIFDDSENQDYARILDFHLNEDDSFPTKASVIDKLNRLPQTLEKENFDIIFVATPDYLDKNLAAEITKIRNNREIKKQPMFFIMKSRKNEKEFDNLKKFDDIVEIPPFIHIDELASRFKSVPELLGYIEDQYGDKWQKNKISFYRAYKDRINQRSKITADTEKELEILENIFEKYNVKKILDAGGGNGRIAIPLSEAGYEVTNADSSRELLEEMKGKTNKVEAIEAGLKNLPLKDGQFDAVTYNWHVFCDILGVKGKKQVLSEAFRILKEGGVIVLDLPDREKSDYKKDGIYIHCPDENLVFVGYIPTEDEMRKYLEEAGFKNVKINKWKTGNGFPKISFIAEK